MLGASAEAEAAATKTITNTNWPTWRQTDNRETDSQVTSTDQLKKKKTTTKTKKEERGKVGQANTHTHS